jgi:fluoroquinolone resistance protein
MGLRGVEFRGTKLMGVDWSEASPNPTVKFTDCTLRYASFVDNNLRATTFLRCSLAEAAFASASLVEAVFDDCELAGARFEGCDLRDADFSKSRGVFFEPTKNRPKGAKVSLETATLIAMSFGLVVKGFSSAS